MKIYSYSLLEDCFNTASGMDGAQHTSRRLPDESCDCFNTASGMDGAQQEKSRHFPTLDGGFNTASGMDGAQQHPSRALAWGGLKNGFGKSLFGFVRFFAAAPNTFSQASLERLSRKRFGLRNSLENRFSKSPYFSGFSKTGPIFQNSLVKHIKTQVRRPCQGLVRLPCQ